MALARAEGAEELASLGGGDAAMVVRMDGQVTALSRFEPDPARLAPLVEKLEASDTPADLPRALQAAADALAGRKDPMIVLIGDGHYPEEARARVRWGGAAGGLGAVDLGGLDVRFVPVGQAARNVGIVAFNVRRYLANKLSYEALVELENFGKAAETVRLTLSSGDEPLSVKTLTLAPGERARHIVPDLGGGDERALRARLELVGAGGAVEADAFPLDDNAVALLPERRRQRVLLVSNDNLYLEAALLLDANIAIDKLRPDEYERELAAGHLRGYDVAVFDGAAPAAPAPTAGALYFRPPAERSPVAQHGEINRPFVTEVNPDHPLTRWVTLADLNIDKAAVLEPGPGDVVIARSIRDPLIVAGKHAGQKLVVFGFGLDATDLMLRVAFPVLLVNALDWFAGDDAELVTTYRTGRMWSIPVDASEEVREVAVRGPAGALTAPVSGGRAHLYGRSAGLYTVTAPGGPITVAANLADPEESDITPVAELVLGGKTLTAPPTFTLTASRSLWLYLVLAALLLSTVEWLTYNRRITV
jgi:hypothetical protein